jgi:phage regulator Rha-like protein
MSRYVKACSRAVHKVFGKDHKNVLQKIDNIIEDDEDDEHD